MPKLMFFVKRKPGLSREHFVRHYEESHAPLALKYGRTSIKRYARNYVAIPPDGPEPDFDCITEIWFDDMEACQSTIDSLIAARNYVHGQSPGDNIFRRDEEMFMDREKLAFFVVDERVSK